MPRELQVGCRGSTAQCLMRLQFICRNFSDYIGVREIMRDQERYVAKELGVDLATAADMLFRDKYKPNLWLILPSACELIEEMKPCPCERCPCRL